jgi:hypothetical protein
MLRRHLNTDGGDGGGAGPDSTGEAAARGGGFAWIGRCTPRERRIMRKLAIVLAVLAIPLASAPGAMAAPPEIFPVLVVEDTFVDEELCGFPVTVSFRFVERHIHFLDEEGNVVRDFSAIQFEATLTNEATGKTVLEREAVRVAFDEATGEVTFTGLPFRFFMPAVGLIVRDVGLVTFSEAGIVVIHGPHPSLTDSEATIAELCGVLADP